MKHTNEALEALKAIKRALDRHLENGVKMSLPSMRELHQWAEQAIAEEDKRG